MPTPHVKPTQIMLGLPAERHAQLRALADHRGVTAVAVVEQMLRRAIEDSEIPDALPGLCEVKQIWEDVLGVSIRGRSLPPLDRLQVSVLATMLNAAAGREQLPNREFKVGQTLSFTLDHGHKVFVGRNASAVLLGIVDGKTGETSLRTTTTASLAADFAALLRKEADKMTLPLTRARPNALHHTFNTETAMPSIPNNEAKQ
jgi:hypothetical protein